jgi:hypothetical protein
VRSSFSVVAEMKAAQPRHGTKQGMTGQQPHERITHGTSGNVGLDFENKPVTGTEARGGPHLRPARSQEPPCVNVAGK